MTSKSSVVNRNIEQKVNKNGYKVVSYEKNAPKEKLLNEVDTNK